MHWGEAEGSEEAGSVYWHGVNAVAPLLDMCVS